jgi:NAD(P)-dependent dehydrogenase (short-subunit alcohol dehydrogenase family)
MPSTIINVSSLLAIKAFPGWSLYATAKAARDMFHAVVAEEVCQSSGGKHLLIVVFSSRTRASR